MQSVILHQTVKYITICLLFKKKKKKVTPLWRTFQATLSLVSTVTQIAQSGTCGIYQSCRGFFSPLCFTDGSNNFLKICSVGGDIDVYIGDGGSADIQTQEGEFTVCELVKYTGCI